MSHVKIYFWFYINILCCNNRHKKYYTLLNTGAILSGSFVRGILDVQQLPFLCSAGQLLQTSFITYKNINAMNWTVNVLK